MLLNIKVRICRSPSRFYKQNSAINIEKSSGLVAFPQTPLPSRLWHLKETLNLKSAEERKRKVMKRQSSGISTNKPLVITNH